MNPLAFIDVARQIAALSNQIFAEAGVEVEFYDQETMDGKTDR